MTDNQRLYELWLWWNQVPHCTHCHADGHAACDCPDYPLPTMFERLTVAHDNVHPRSTP